MGSREGSGEATSPSETERASSGSDDESARETSLRLRPAVWEGSSEGSGPVGVGAWEGSGPALGVVDGCGVGETEGTAVGATEGVHEG